MWISKRTFCAVALVLLTGGVLVGCAAPVSIRMFDSNERPEFTPHYDVSLKTLAKQLEEPGLIELLNEARTLESVDSDRAVDRYLEVASASYERIGSIEEATTRELWIREVYNRAVAGVIRSMSVEDLGDDPRIRLNDEFANGIWSDIAYFDTLTPAADVWIEGIRDHVAERGVGAPLIAFRENEEVVPLEDLYPPEGILRPVTAVLSFEDDGAAQLTLYDPRKVDRIAWSGMNGAQDLTFKLATDFTAPYASLLSRTQVLSELGFAGMLNPGEMEDRLGIYLIEPYDPNKIPILMTHGLMSTPLAWIELTNAVQTDPVLRSRYQVWHFLYPTGPCPFYSAYMLRVKLEEARLLLDPELDDPAMQDIVAIGHSMGGILTRTLVSDSGAEAWGVAFSAPPEALVGDPETIDLMANIFMYEHRPYVNRAIFVATPHRGSRFADNLIGRFGNSLVRLPEHCVQATKAVARANRDKLTPGYGPWLLNGPPPSIRTLSPDSPASSAVETIPIREGVTYHTIVGTRTMDFADHTTTTDGIVEYRSAFLDGAASEAYVPSGHDAHQHPEGVDEILRILREHAGLPAGSELARQD